MNNTIGTTNNIMLLLVVFECNAQQVQQVIDNQELVHMQERSSKLQLIDVRTPEELAKGEIPGSKNIDLLYGNWKGSQ